MFRRRYEGRLRVLGSTCTDIPPLWPSQQQVPVTICSIHHSRRPGPLSYSTAPCCNTHPTKLSRGSSSTKAATSPRSISVPSKKPATGNPPAETLRRARQPSDQQWTTQAPALNDLQADSEICETLVNSHSTNIAHRDSVSRIQKPITRPAAMIYLSRSRGRGSRDSDRAGGTGHQTGFEPEANMSNASQSRKRQSSISNSEGRQRNWRNSASSNVEVAGPGHDPRATASSPRSPTSGATYSQPDSQGNQHGRSSAWPYRGENSHGPANLQHLLYWRDHQYGVSSNAARRWGSGNHQPQSQSHSGTNEWCGPNGTLSDRPLPTQFQQQFSIRPHIPASLDSAFPTTTTTTGHGSGHMSLPLQPYGNQAAPNFVNPYQQNLAMLNRMASWNPLTTPFTNFPPMSRGMSAAHGSRRDYSTSTQRPKWDTVEPPSAPTPTEKYLAQATRTPQSSPDARDLLVILDINGTLLKRKHRTLPPVYTQRRALDTFMKVLFKKYTVMIWSSSQPETVDAICAKLFSESERAALVAEWARDKFGLTRRQYHSKTQVYKQLEKVWADKVIQGRHPAASTTKNSRKGRLSNLPSTQRWDQTNTILIDDSRLKAAGQPWNILEVPEFVKASDEENMYVFANVLDRLDKLSRSTDVSQMFHQWNTAADAIPWHIDPGFPSLSLEAEEVHRGQEIRTIPASKGLQNSAEKNVSRAATSASESGNPRQSVPSLESRNRLPPEQTQSYTTSIDSDDSKPKDAEDDATPLTPSQVAEARKLRRKKRKKEKMALRRAAKALDYDGLEHSRRKDELSGDLFDKNFGPDHWVDISVEAQEPLSTETISEGDHTNAEIRADHEERGVTSDQPYVPKRHRDMRPHVRKKMAKRLAARIAREQGSAEATTTSAEVTKKKDSSHGELPARQHSKFGPEHSQHLPPRAEQLPNSFIATEGPPIKKKWSRDRTYKERKQWKKEAREAL